MQRSMQYTDGYTKFTHGDDVSDGGSSPLDSVAAIVGPRVLVAFPHHDAAVVGRLLRHLYDAVVEVLWVNVTDLLLRRRQPEVDLRRRVRRRPLVPLSLPVGGAVGVVVEPDEDASDEPRGERPLHVPVRVAAPRRGRQLHRRPAAEVLVEVPEPLGQLVVVGRRAVLDEEVDAIDEGVAERAVDALAGAEHVGVPDVVGDVRRGLGGGQGVLVAEAPDGEEDEDVLGLAVLDVGADGGDVVAGQVEVVVAAAEDVEEGDDGDGVGAGVAGLAEGPLVLVPTPEHGHLAGLPRGRGRDGKEGCGAEESREE
uniref:Uncharacterized protein n=1 Tax=Triticum urartu TaxID=4572 RepID=A0A8R7Q5C2_TRIUA